ncbi:MAG: hypothetical protein ACI8ZM_001111 [Crocinitomix sp.]|jgi:hypothetical protein
MKSLILIIVLGLTQFAMAQAKPLSNSKVDYNGFETLTSEIGAYREGRLIQIDTFNLYSQDGNTIILDTRSKAAYDEIHIAGAVHLNFSDFTVAKLAKVIPNKATRILIYCNNNIESNFSSLEDKLAPLALNIPTFINLFGYGYTNVYELQDYLMESDPRIEFVKGK